MVVLGNLYLIPVPINDGPINAVMPDYNLEIVRRLKNFITENAKEGRRHLKKMAYPAIAEAKVLELNEHNKKADLRLFLTELLNGHDVGLMSDAGCPGIADPGAEIVKLAHENNIRVIPLVGPSSIVLSIMASGFNGQNFAFVGYLPIDRIQRIRRIKELEQLAIKHNQAQFFIETPYRNEILFELLIEQLSATTKLFIGLNIMSPDQYLSSKSISAWKKNNKIGLQKIPAVYGIYF